MLKLKTEKGKDKVKVLVKSGKDYSQSEITIAKAKEMIENGEVTESDVSDFPLCVDNKYYFPATKTSEVKKKDSKEETTAEEAEEKVSD